MKTVATNRKALYNYFIIEKLETGIELKGTEVKSLREGKVSLEGGYSSIENGELWLHDVHIPRYEHSGYITHDPKRAKKLLIHRLEIKKLYGKTKERGLTLIPLSIYFNRRGIAKVELAIARGKRQRDKRETIKKRIQMREIEERTKRRRKERW